MKALGVPILRLHSDREKTFMSKGFQKWCRHHGLYQTMTSGDDGPANGRVECEVNQIKRRLRVALAASKPMIPLGEMVVVKKPRGGTSRALCPLLSGQ